MRVVEDVVSARADGKPHALGNLDVLIQGGVDVEVAGAEHSLLRPILPKPGSVPAGRNIAEVRQGVAALGLERRNSVLGRNSEKATKKDRTPCEVRPEYVMLNPG
jgi:hypothetical protein